MRTVGPPFTDRVHLAPVESAPSRFARSRSVPVGTVGVLWYSFAMADHVAAALDKMRAAGAHPAELAAMTRRLE